MDLKMMNYEDRLKEIEARVKSIVIQQFQFDCQPEEVDPTQDFFLESFGFTSIDALELLMRVEGELSPGWIWTREVEKAANFDCNK